MLQMPSEWTTNQGMKAKWRTKRQKITITTSKTGWVMLLFVIYFCILLQSAAINRSVLDWNAIVEARGEAIGTVVRSESACVCVDCRSVFQINFA